MCMHVRWRLVASNGLFTAANGKPLETLVNALASFGAGAMLGDTFLHQLPHAFGESESPHSHDTHQHHYDHGHSHGHDLSPAAGQGHAHCLQTYRLALLYFEESSSSLLLRRL